MADKDKCLRTTTQYLYIINQNTTTMITLKNVLLINSISSGVTGIGLIAFASPASSMMGIAESAICVGVGIFLVAFALLVFLEGRRDQAREARVRLITALDASWVVASIIVVAAPIEFTIIGRIAIIAVALWVAMMAFLQFRGLRTTAS
jgi:hypothetical protein